MDLLKIILLSVLLSSCASAEDLINRAIKKDPEVLKKRMSAEIIYITDTVPVYLDGKIIRVPVDVPVEVPVIKWVKERTNKEERLNERLLKEQLKQERFERKRDKEANDIQSKKLQLENKMLKAEVKLKNEEVRKERRERQSDFLNWLRFNWLTILITILVLRFLPNIIKWGRKLYEQLRHKLGK